MGHMKIARSKIAKQKMVFKQLFLFLIILICFVNITGARERLVTPSGGRLDGSGTIEESL